MRPQAGRRNPFGGKWFNKAYPAVKALAALLLTLSAASAQPRALFDGKTLAGWEGDPKVWRVEDGAIAGGSLDRNQPRNDFLVTTESFGDFELTFEVRLRGTGFVNSGLQFRSERIPKNHEMRGYQADIGPGWWGKLYDESRRNRVIADLPAPLRSVKEGDWNRYRLVANGARLRAWVNDEPAFDFTEPQSDIPRAGKIGLQLHGGGKAKVEFRNLILTPLAAAPAAPAAPTAPPPPPAPAASPLTARQQLSTFSLPPGYVIELVAEESEGVGKFVTAEWDLQGRLWSTTALEYPVDANEAPAAAAALYASRAKDKVLVFDRAEGPGPHKPRVFAEGLAIPTGMLPYRNGAIVHHGTDIVRLEDSDGDGKSDKRSVLLSGFGVQDSHLFPHQFTRAPGGWIWMAQGAFNYGKVRTTSGKETKFDQTRMAKFRPDGSDFDITSNGPCNIWGLVLTDEGEAWIQEANDFGYPVMPFHEYGNYPGCSNGLWKSYAPEFPATARSFRMGGTGLSGLAWADPGRWPADTAGLIWVANPITRKIQSVRATREGAGYSYELGPELVLSSDPWFRPVALRNGPDGCLYIVDWYNKIISHNEVPRNHPERDKVRGRIWRVRHQDHAPLPTVDFAALAPTELLSHLGTASLGRTHLAWQAIVDRNLTQLEPALRARLLDGSLPAGQRIPALWALEGLGVRDLSLVGKLVADANRNVRREALRALSEFPAGQARELVALAAKAAEDPDPTVRQEVIKLAGRLAGESPAALDLLVRQAKPSLPGPIGESTQRKRPIPVGAAYDREFERYLVRLFLEQIPGKVAAYLDQDRRSDLEPEAEMWASLALGPEKAGPRVARLLGALGREPSREELTALLRAADNPLAAQSLRQALLEGEGQQRVAAALIGAKSQLDAAKVAPLLAPAAQALLRRGGEPAARGLALAEAFALRATEAELDAVLAAPARGAEHPAALRALASFGGGDVAKLLELSAQGEPALRREALLALAANAKPGAAAALLGIWEKLDAPSRELALERLSQSASGAAAILGAALEGRIPSGALTGSVVERLQGFLPKDPRLEQLMSKVADRFRPAAVMDGTDKAQAPLGIKLAGAFTVETWVWLEPDISNVDGILGQDKKLDINFANGLARVYLFPPRGDVVIAKKPVSAGHWMHLAVTRDAQGRWSIYQNGEHEATGAPTDLRPLEPSLGWTVPKGSLHGALAEYRIWGRALSAEEIRAGFDRAVDPSARPEDLLFLGSGREGWPKAAGIRVALRQDPPPILGREEAARLDAAFARWGKLIREDGGDPAKGKALAALCRACHLIKGEGVAIGPDLSGVGAMGHDAILRNLLTPNAAYEPGYRVFRVTTKAGALHEGFMASDTPEAVVLRLTGGAEVRVARGDIASTRWINRSLMPAGLVENLPDEQARDLLAYLKSLR